MTFLCVFFLDVRKKDKERRKRDRSGGGKHSLLLKARRSFILNKLQLNPKEFWKLLDVHYWQSPNNSFLFPEMSHQLPCPRTNNIDSCRPHSYGRCKRASQSWLVRFKSCSVHCVGNIKAFSRWHHKSSDFAKHHLSFEKWPLVFHSPHLSQDGFLLPWMQHSH